MNQIDNFEESPLWIASRYGYFSIVEYLISHGADVNQSNTHGVSPVWITSKSGHLSTVKYLISHGADVKSS